MIVFDLMSVFGAGVVVSFTPCVYPVIPIISSVIGGFHQQGSRWRGLLFSLLYTLGLALTYSVLAFLAVTMGKVFGVFQQSPLAFLTIAALLLVFSLMMFGLIPVPWAQMKMTPKSSRKSWFFIFLMGLLSGLMVAPCTSPVLGSLLLYVAGRENILYGCLLLFVFAYGIGFSLILVGTFGGLLMALPKPGVWMVWIQKIIASVLLLISLFYFIQFLKAWIER